MLISDKKLPWKVSFDKIVLSTHFGNCRRNKINTEHVATQCSSMCIVCHKRRQARSQSERAFYLPFRWERFSHYREFPGLPNFRQAIRFLRLLKYLQNSLINLRINWQLFKVVRIRLYTPFKPSHNGIMFVSYKPGSKQQCKDNP